MVIGIGRSEDNGTRTTFEASTTADVLSAVERFAKAHSEACQASVHLIEGALHIKGSPHIKGAGCT